VFRALGGHAHLLNLSWAQLGQRSLQGRYQNEKLREPVGLGTKDDDAEGPAGDPLLLGQAPVDRDESIEPIPHCVEQGTVGEVSPAHFGGSPHFVAGERPTESARHAGIEQDPQTELAR
jgi:hypothetical protein